MTLMTDRVISPSAIAALQRLGQSIQVARVRRRVRQRDLAVRMGVSIGTLRALEAGAPGVSMGNLAMALLALGNLSKLDDLADVRQDDIGLLMDVGALPKRVRLRSGAGRTPVGGGLRIDPSPEGALL